MVPYEDRKKWRLAHPESRNASRKQNYDSTRKFGTKGGRPWSNKEVRAIISPGRPTDRVLAKKLGRTVHAIQGKRNWLKHTKAD